MNHFDFRVKEKKGNATRLAISFPVLWEGLWETVYPTNLNVRKAFICNVSVIKNIGVVRLEGTEITKNIVKSTFLYYRPLWEENSGILFKISRFFSIGLMFL